MIDLHCHSYFSDGTLSPEDLVIRAVNANLNFLALTDHDTVAGLERLHDAARGSALQIVNGIELSVRWKKYDIHLIGLQINPADLSLARLIERQKELRIERAIQIGELLQKCGVDNAYQKARGIAGHERVGRPHFAQVLIQEHRVADMKTAFKHFLGLNQKAYVPVSWIDLDEATQGIVQAGGQAVIAHPLKYKLTRTKLHELIKAFKRVNGVGIEVVSGEMSGMDMQILADLCVRFELLASSGSDYHSDTMSRVGLGRQAQLSSDCKPIWQTWSVN